MNLTNEKVIGIDLTGIYATLSGVQRYAIEIAKRIIQNDNKFVLFFAKEIHRDFVDLVKRDNVECVIIDNHKKITNSILRLPKYAKRKDIDSMWFPIYPPSIFYKYPKNIKKFSTIHDLVCVDMPKTMKFTSRMYYLLTTKHAMKTSHKILTVSEFSRRRIMEHYKMNNDDVLVFYNGITDFKTDDGQDKFIFPEEYILSVSTLEPRKNFQSLIKWMIDEYTKDASLPPLVLVGRKGWLIEDVIPDIPESLKEKFIFTGFLSDTQLKEAYSKAKLFIYPSLYEGFGIPIVEAIHYGAIPLVSDIEVFKEIISDPNFRFSLSDTNDFHNKLMFALSLDEKSRKKYLLEFKNSIKNFTWDIAADGIYKLLLNS